MEYYCYLCGKKFYHLVYVYENQNVSNTYIECCSQECWNILNDCSGKIPFFNNETYRITGACFRCQHFENLKPESKERGLWWNHICGFTRKHQLQKKVKSFTCKDVFDTIICHKITNFFEEEITRFELMDI